MIRGLVGKKLGMTQIFDKEGNIVPVTVVEVGPCKILELKENPMKVKIGFGEIK
jgi:large subunit ribosomal protein L3